ncbi:hypothetical protein ACIBI9_11230 [Nonomuraea sp. NPDC050451]|uniref:hypothetical protein n=1 Tax=Nonomuraea sp. NPDC050451 TaxID=3364364 RepID=UPI00378854A3
MALGDVNGELGASGSRPVLVGLRRALHTGRLRSGRELAAVLPYGLRGEVEEWVRRARECAGLRARLPEVVARESLEKEERLRAAAADPAFRRGLTLAGGELAADLERWLADPARRPKPQKLLRLAKYLVRAAVKTSPYSSAPGEGGAAVLTAASLGALTVLMAVALRRVVAVAPLRRQAGWPMARPRLRVAPLRWRRSRRERCPSRGRCGADGGA